MVFTLQLTKTIVQSDDPTRAFALLQQMQLSSLLFPLSSDTNNDERLWQEGLRVVNQLHKYDLVYFFSFVISCCCACLRILFLTSIIFPVAFFFSSQTSSFFFP